LQATVAKKLVHRGDHGAAVQTIAQGVPDRFGQPVVTMPVWFFLSHPGLRVRPAPGIPCALCSGRDEVLGMTRTQFAPRECGGLFSNSFVIPGRATWRDDGLLFEM
jgi:hypothetical protein